MASGTRGAAHSIELEPLEVGPFVDIAGWYGPVASRAVVRWRRTPSIVADFAPEPGGKVAIRALTLEGSESRTLTSADMRSFQFRELSSALAIFLRSSGPDSRPGDVVSISLLTRDDIEEAIRAQAEHVPTNLEGIEIELGPDLLDEITDPDRLRELKSHGPRTLGAVTIVNALLDYASRQGRPPHTFVREVLQLPKSTATRWIAAARELASRGEV